jgi:hypothetical protein
MNIANMAFPNAGEFGMVVATLLTLMVYSYLVLDDNLLFRLAAHILVGVAVGYAVVVAVHDVLIPKLGAISGDLTLLVPLLFCLFLLVRPARALAWFSNYPIALMLGVGAALAIVGAVGGVLIPQVMGSAVPLRFTSTDPLALMNDLIILVGVIATLSSFYFTARRGGRGRRLLRWIRPTGRFFIAVALGSLFAGLLVSRLSLLVGRIEFLVEFVDFAWRMVLGS